MIEILAILVSKNDMFVFGICNMIFIKRKTYFGHFQGLVHFLNCHLKTVWKQCGGGVS